MKILFNKDKVKKNFTKNADMVHTGFTLLEVMISVSIMSIVLVAVYKMHMQSISMNNITMFNTIAPLLAQKKNSQFQQSLLNENGFLNDINSDSGAFGDKFPSFSWKMSVDDVDSDLLGNISKDLKKVDITVIYNENEYVYNLRTYFFVRS